MAAIPFEVYNSLIRSHEQVINRLNTKISHTAAPESGDKYGQVYIGTNSWNIVSSDGSHTSTAQWNQTTFTALDQTTAGSKTVAVSAGGSTFTVSDGTKTATVGVAGNVLNVSDGTTTNNLDMGALQTAQVQFTGTNAWNINNQTLVVRGGAGTALVFDSAVMEINPGVTTFNGAPTFVVTWKTGPVSASGNYTATTDIQGTAQVVRRIGAIDASPVVNDYLTIGQTGTSSQGTGTITVFVRYRNLTLA